ncbi:MAG: NAD(+) synthase, partial [Bacteroidaceae bacterium]|nr:NAD(+) synthase [Bacteroidaceae bacterium]
MKYGFVRVAAGIPEVKVADTQHNVEEIEKLVLRAQAQNVEILVTPELSLTGYTCQDLFFQQTLVEEAEIALMKLMDFTRSMDMILIVGMPVVCNHNMLNCAVVLQKGKIQGIVAKSFLSNHRDSSEKRWFTSITEAENSKVWLCGDQVEISRYHIFNTPSCSFAIEIGHDMWAPIPPSSTLSLMGAEIILCPAADSSFVGKNDYITNLVCAQSAACIGGYVYASAGFGESSTDLVYGGKALICENGNILCEKKPYGMEPGLILSEIDVEKIRGDRRSNKIFSDSTKEINKEKLTITNTDMMARRDLELSRHISQHPFYSEDKAQL